MPITVGELLEMPHLQLSIHAGGSALARAVEWTHTTDLPEPWRWVTGGELLMTNGMPVPRDAAGQKYLVHQLIEHGAAALAIGAKMYCPPLTKTMTRLCDHLGFPVLWIAYPMPFVAISRAVAEATLLEQSQRLIRTERIYRGLQRISADESSLHDLTRALTGELGCPVRICARDSGEDWAPGREPLPEQVREAVVRRRGRLRAGVVAIALPGDRRALAVDLPTQPDAVLLALPEPSAQPDALLLQHAATVAALAISQARLHIEHERRSGAELLLQMLDGTLPPAVAARRLAETGVDAESALVVALRCPAEPDRQRELHLRLWRALVPHVTVAGSDVAYALLPNTEAALTAVNRAAGAAGHVGVSRPLGGGARLAQAQTEALWALEVAVDRHAGLATYDDATPALGPRTPEEARLLVDRVLGGLLALPVDQSAQLLATLRVFLAHGRSWQRTAQQLHVHRQTVLYRIRKVEQLTGRDLGDTADLATVWLAVQALDRTAA